MEENNGVQEQTPEMVEVENMDETVLANAVSDAIKYEFTKSYLVKQLPVKMLKKTMKFPEPTGEQDEDGNDITDMVERETEVESVLRTGIVLKVPFSQKAMGQSGPVRIYEVGDRVVYRNMRATDFDLLPEAALVDPFDIICSEEN